MTCLIVRATMRPALTWRPNLPSASTKVAASFALPKIGVSTVPGTEQKLAGKSTITLQSMILAQPGVCTEQSLHYTISQMAWVSEPRQTVFLGPNAKMRLDTFANMIGIGVWDRACRLEGLYLALSGTGQVELRVCQVRIGRSVERLITEVCELSADRETVIDLSHYLPNPVGGAIWFELRNCSAVEIAAVTAARYFTGIGPVTEMRLALCLARPNAHVVGRLENWCKGAGLASGAAVLVSAAETTALAQLAAAKAQGFSHAVLMDPTTVISTEALNRVVSYLTLARSADWALGAAILDPGDKKTVAANGMMLNHKGKLTPRFQGVDLSDRLQVVGMECELADENEHDIKLRFQPEFLGLALRNLPETLDETAHDAGLDACLCGLGFKLQHLTGVMVDRENAAADAVGDLVTLQHVIYPEAGLCTEVAMFYHNDGPVNFTVSTGALSIEQLSIVQFDSYFNALNIGKWHATCEPDGLYLGLLGQGRVMVKVYHAIPDRSWELLCDAPYTLSPMHEILIDLSGYAMTAVTGMIYFELHAISQGVQLLGARYAVPGKINPDISLCLSITTFKRETEVENTARRMAQYFDTCDFADQMHLNIVDNGNSAKILENAKITRIPNANLGGAGGFTRGLIEADKSGYSHVLFMDDDASIPMEALHRAYAFLTLSKDPKAAVSGAMISNSDKWRMWENGAIFDRNCRPQFTGTDLRNWTEVMEMEFKSASTRSSKAYGGWWFFAFPVKEVTHYPFPFFVRGDDINFSLANDFHITTLNGVVSFAEDFSDKESPLTLYLDLRNHFVQHLTLPKMEIGPLNIARIGIGFFLRNAIKFQYETIDALLMAWNDVLKGPEFFAENADASAQRAAVKALYKVESWKPAADMDLTDHRRYSAGERGWKWHFFRWTLNGHLLPFYNLWGNRVVVQPRDRNNFRPVWGSSRLTYLNSTRDKAYTTRQSKTRFLARSFRLLWLTLRLYFGYKPLLAKYRKGYAEITVPGFWQKALKLTKPVPQPEVDPVAATKT